ncbi:MAG: ABC transporter permease [Streptosporangiaceae bacterium]
MNAIRQSLTSFGNETRKGLQVAWSEKLQILIELPFFALLTLMLGPLLGAGHQILTGHVHWSLNSARTSDLVLWFIPFFYFYMQVVKLFWRLLGEIQSGTLEQVYLSPLPSWLVVAGGRVAAALTEAVLVAAALYGIISAFVPLHFHWTAAELVPAVLLILTVIGFSLVIAGMTIRWKRIQMLIETAMVAAMIFSASAIPLLHLPGWMAAAGRYFPVTNGIYSLYGVMLGHRGVTAPWGNGGLVWVLATAAAYLAVGILAFRFFERSARIRGTLAAY